MGKKSDRLRFFILRMVGCPSTVISIHYSIHCHFLRKKMYKGLIWNDEDGKSKDRAHRMVGG